MDENMVNNETIDETTDTINEFYEDADDSGILGKVLVGGAAVATGVAAGFAIKNKEKIASFIESKKEARRQKKVAKVMAKLAKLEAKAKPVIEEVEVEK